jgi:sec-independent protein translocase protein TatB
MNFFGVGPLELFFILILGLIVLGPERLPEAGRFLGRKLAELMAWQQQSPEAQMIQQIRQDFEHEIVELRNELVQARAQLNVREDMEQLRAETRAMFSLKDQESAAKAGNNAGSVSADQLPNKVAAAGKRTDTAAAAETINPITSTPEPPPSTSTGPALPEAPATTPAKSVPRGRPDDDDPEWGKRPHPSKLKSVPDQRSNGSAQAATTGAAAATPADVQALQSQVEVLMAEIHELHARLHQHQANGVAPDLPVPTAEYK